MRQVLIFARKTTRGPPFIVLSRLDAGIRRNNGVVDGDEKRSQNRSGPLQDDYSQVVLKSLLRKHPRIILEVSSYNYQEHFAGPFQNKGGGGRENFHPYVNFGSHNGRHYGPAEKDGPVRTRVARTRPRNVGRPRACALHPLFPLISGAPSLLTFRCTSRTWSADRNTTSPLLVSRSRNVSTLHT